MFGPALIGFDDLVLEANKGKSGGPLSNVAGTFIAESAIPKDCGINSFFGINTRKKKSPAKKINQKIRKTLV